MTSSDFDELGGAVSKRALKIYWLVDVSISMSGDKIATVNRAIKAVIPDIQSEAEDNPTVKTYARVMKFSNGAQWHTSETEIEKFQWIDLFVDGRTDTGAALKLMAQELTIEKMGKRAIPPVIILMSDGDANDDYDAGLNILLQQRWAAKSVRIAIAIGDDANISELSKFCSSKEIPPLEAKKASDLIRYIKWASTEVPKSVSNSVINNSTSNVHIPQPPQQQVTIGGNNQSIWDGDVIF